jgi:hypothetical protein
MLLLSKPSDRIGYRQAELTTSLKQTQVGSPNATAVNP